MVFLTEQTNQKFQISHEGIICWLVSKKDQYKQKNKTHFSSLMNEVFWIAELQIEGWKEICLISKLGPTTYRLPLKMGNQSFHDFFDNCNCVPPPPSLWTFPLHFLTDFVNNEYKSFAAKIDKIRRRTMSNIPWNLDNITLRNCV